MNRLTSKLVLLMFTIGFVCCLSAAQAGPPWSVDDPATTPKGYVYSFTSFQSSESRGKESYMFPDLLLCYGITDNFMVKIESGLITKRAGKKVETGLEDTLIGAKWRFLNETKTLPQMSIAFQSKLPSADASRGLGTGDTDYKFTYTIAKSFGRFKLAANGGQNFMGDIKSRDYAFFGALATYKLTEKLDIGAQWYGYASPGHKKNDEKAWGVGMKYRYAPDHALLFSAGRSERGYSNLNTYVGLQVNFK